MRVSLCPCGTMMALPQALLLKEALIAWRQLRKELVWARDVKRLRAEATLNEDWEEVLRNEPETWKQQLAVMGKQHEAETTKLLQQIALQDSAAS